MVWPKGKRRAESTRVKLRAANLGKRLSPETRAKMSDSRMGHTVSPETRAKIGMANERALRGRNLTEEHRANISSSLIGNTRTRGHKHTVEARANMSVGSSEHVARCQGACNSVGCSPPRSPTHIEDVLIKLLAEFPEVRREEHFGSYWVDVYLPPPYHLAFEADGDYWHKIGSDQSKHDAKRDAYLLREHDLPVIRLTERQLMAMEV